MYTDTNARMAFLTKFPLNKLRNKFLRNFSNKEIKEFPIT